MIRYLVSLALVKLAIHMATHEEDFSLTPDEEAALQSIWETLLLHGEEEARQRAWDLVAEEVARMVADGWDQYGAPTVAALSKGHFFAHYTSPKGEGILEAQSKREAYRLARRAWIRDLLG